MAAILAYFELGFVETQISEREPVELGVIEPDVVIEKVTLKGVAQLRFTMDMQDLPVNVTLNSTYLSLEI